MPAEAIAAFALELISQALVDLEARGRYGQERLEDALEWFNRRDTSPCGYGWALGASGANPNQVRRNINKRLRRYHASQEKNEQHQSTRQANAKR